MNEKHKARQTKKILYILNEKWQQFNTPGYKDVTCYADGMSLLNAVTCVSILQYKENMWIILSAGGNPWALYTDLLRGGV